MRRRYILIIVVILIGGLVSIYYGLFTSYNYVSSIIDVCGDSPKIIKYGEATIYDKSSVMAASILGIEYVIIPENHLTIPAKNGIDSYNAFAAKYLANKLGEDWRSSFNYLKDSVFYSNRIDTIVKVVQSRSEIKILSSYLDSVSEGKDKLHIWVIPLNERRPNVRVGIKMADSSARVFRYYYVDPFTLECSLIQY